MTELYYVYGIYRKDALKYYGRYITIVRVQAAKRGFSTTNIFSMYKKRTHKYEEIKESIQDVRIFCMTMSLNSRVRKAAALACIRYMEYTPVACISSEVDRRWDDTGITVINSNKKLNIRLIDSSDVVLK